MLAQYTIYFNHDLTILRVYYSQNHFIAARTKFLSILQKLEQDGSLLFFLRNHFSFNVATRPDTKQQQQLKEIKKCKECTVNPILLVKSSFLELQNNYSHLIMRIVQKYK